MKNKAKQKTQKEQEKEAVAQAIKQAKALPFGRKVWLVFTKTIFLTSLCFFSLVFAIIAILTLPIALPIAFFSSYLKGQKIKI